MIKALFAFIICMTLAILVRARPMGTGSPHHERYKYDLAEISSIATILAIIFISVVSFVWDRWKAWNLPTLLRYETFQGPKLFWYRHIALYIGALVAGLRKFLDFLRACKTPTLNSDIGGVGVLVGPYVPPLLVTISMIMGCSTGLDTGTKELGSIVLMGKSILMP
jgi:hypothetical protein